MCVGDEWSKEKLSGHAVGSVYVGERVGRGQKAREMSRVVRGLLAKNLTVVGPLGGTRVDSVLKMELPVWGRSSPL